MIVFHESCATDLDPASGKPIASRVDEGRPIFEDASSPLRTPDVRISRIRRSHVLFMKGIRGQRLRLSWITPNLW
jgi:hypothetical protein